MLWIVLGAWIAVSAYWLARPKQPFAEGRSLGGWLQEYSRSRNAHAAEVIHGMGDSALPALIEYLADRDSPTWRAYHQFYTNRSVLVQRCLPTPHRPAGGTAYELLAFEPRVKDHLPRVAALAGHRNAATRFDALSLLARNVQPEDAQYLPLLIQASRDADARVRKNALMGIIKIRLGPFEALPDLKRALNDPDVDVRNYAAWALERIGISAAR